MWVIDRCLFSKIEFLLAVVKVEVVQFFDLRLAKFESYQKRLTQKSTFTSQLTVVLRI